MMDETVSAGTEGGAATLASRPRKEEPGEDREACKEPCSIPFIMFREDWKVFAPGTFFSALAVIEKDEGAFMAHSPSLPGAVSQGDSAEEALKNLKEALAGCIEAYLESKEDIPWVRDAAFEGEAVVKKWINVDV